MNLSEEQEFMTCNIFVTEYAFISKLSSHALYINHTIVLAINSILVIQTILLNAVSIMTISKSSQLKSKPCYFIILIQSAADLVVGVLGIPLYLANLSGKIRGDSNCFVAVLAYILLPITLGTSTFILFGMTLERYIAVLHPYSYSRVTKKKILIFVCFAVTGVVFVAILSSAIRVLRAVFITAMVTLFFIFAAFVYTRIYLVVIKMAESQKNMHSVAVTEENITRKKRFLQEIKQAKSCFLVVMCYFILCFLPVILALIVAIRGNQFQVQTFYAWTTTLSMLNCSANSLIFFWTKTMLRREAVKMLKSVLSHSP
jgi:hypothetical protein